MRRLASRSNRWGDLSFALGGWSGETKDGMRSKWSPSLDMVAATIKFALETKSLAEESRKEGEEEIDSTANRIEEGNEDSEADDDDLVE